MAGVGAIAHHDDATDGFAFAIPLGDAAPHVRPELHIGNLAQQDRHAVGADTDRDLPQVVEALNVAAHAQDEFFLGHFDGAPANFAVAALHGHAHFSDGKVVCAQAGRIDGDLI